MALGSMATEAAWGDSAAGAMLMSLVSGGSMLSMRTGGLGSFGLLAAALRAERCAPPPEHTSDVFSWYYDGYALLLFYTLMYIDTLFQL